MKTEEQKIKEGSKRLSWLLRHGANEAGLAMDPAGWASCADVLRLARLNRRELEEIVEQNDKSRLQLEGERIRACQGHSLEGMPVTREALEASWEVHPGSDPIWHGTTVEAVPAIAREGIRAVARSHVHLAEDVDARVGKRHHVALLLEVSVKRLREQGREVYRSPNGVLLVREVPPACITDLLARSKAARQVEPELRRLLGLSAV